MGKHKYFKFMGFLKILDEAEIHTIPKTREKSIPIIREKYEKKSKNSKVSQIFWVKQKSIQFPKHGKSESHNTGESMEKKQTFQSYGFLKYFG